MGSFVRAAAGTLILGSAALFAYELFADNPTKSLSNKSKDAYVAEAIKPVYKTKKKSNKNYDAYYKSFGPSSIADPEQVIEAVPLVRSAMKVIEPEPREKQLKSIEKKYGRAAVTLASLQLMDEYNVIPGEMKTLIEMQRDPIYVLMNSGTIEGVAGALVFQFLRNYDKEMKSYKEAERIAQNWTDIGGRAPFSAKSIHKDPYVNWTDESEMISRKYYEGGNVVVERYVIGATPKEVAQARTQQWRDENWARTREDFNQRAQAGINIANQTAQSIGNAGGQAAGQALQNFNTFIQSLQKKE
ncbi:MAG: hypothetical protein QMD85_02045 [Candidatus Aenigmarchaeota archaeon]|nr:hypothetical protein [Candidatus Aenigmarchaeota archaeon]MDI6722331.1 hypothetical protein [Candidatus Aenigmarchaeota archaeon]